jgi:hypothetical protein
VNLLTLIPELIEEMENESILLLFFTYLGWTLKNTLIDKG